MAIAPGRALRPGAMRTAFEPPLPGELDECPFCEGREDRTPPETHAVGRPDREPDTPGWQVRVVPNLYPAFERQEVVVHVPRHVRSLAQLTGEEARSVAQAWQARARSTGAGEQPYLHALVNEGREAGASRAHSHSQLVWLDDCPPLVRAEQDLWRASGCGVCRAVADELGARERIVLERESVVALCPYAGRAPYELLVAPVTHEGDPWTSELLPIGLELAAEALRLLHTVEGPRPANLWLHASGHWHIEVVPRFGILAGIELGAGLAINPLPAEQAAAALRAARAS